MRRWAMSFCATTPSLLLISKPVSPGSWRRLWAPVCLASWRRLAVSWGKSWMARQGQSQRRRRPPGVRRLFFAPNLYLTICRNIVQRREEHSMDRFLAECTRVAGVVAGVRRPPTGRAYRLEDTGIWSGTRYESAVPRPRQGLNPGLG